MNKNEMIMAINERIAELVNTGNSIYEAKGNCKELESIERMVVALERERINIRMA